jgi:hypothetical protein
MPAAFSLVGIDRKGLIVPAAGMDDMIGAASRRSLQARVPDVEDQG